MKTKLMSVALAAALIGGTIATPSFSQPFAPAPRYQERHDDYRFDERRWSDPCKQYRDRGQVRSATLGALVGAAIGASVSDRDDRDQGAVFGAIVGAIAGANVGQHAAQCDRLGYYYRYDQTFPYREPQARRGHYGRRNYDWYRRQRCRLAIAPAQWGGHAEYRYIRVCPDRQGRYRIAD